MADFVYKLSATILLFLALFLATYVGLASGAIPKAEEGDVLGESDDMLLFEIGEHVFDINRADILVEEIDNELTFETYVLNSAEVVGVETGQKGEIKWQEFYASFPFRIGTDNRAFIKDGSVFNCDTNIYNISFDELRLTDELSNKQTGKILLDDYALSSDDVKTIRLCKKYNAELANITETLTREGLHIEYPEEVFGLHEVNGWYIADEFELVLALEEASASLNYEVIPGEIERIGDVIAQIQSYRPGRELDIDKTVSAIDFWLFDSSDGLDFVYDEMLPEYVFEGKQVLDFTNHLGVGKSRIDYVRYGYDNPAVYFSEQGLEEIHNVIVQPGETFSYVEDAIQKQPGLNRTDDGRLIGNGYCNSTTTLFRAVLESGLEVVERHYHAQYIPSFEWGYPINAVEAVFTASEGREIDFQFKNDYDYPILLKFSKEDGGDGWQYHTLDIYGDARSEDREVELYDWKKWNEYSATNYNASFKRKIIVDGEVVKEEVFESDYY